MVDRMIEPYSFPELIDKPVAEHEVFISFNNDSGAVKFHEFWYTEGKEAFEKWQEKNK